MTDSATPAASITATFTLVVNGAQNLTLLNGSYGGSNSAAMAAMDFWLLPERLSNGSGGITTGEMDFNSQQGQPINTKNLTGTYTGTSDGRGTITFANLPTSTFAFSIDSIGHGRFIEFGFIHNSRLRPNRTSDRHLCVVNSTNTSTYAGDFAFGGSGFASQFATNGTGPLAFAGRITATPPLVPATPGSLAQGEMDTNAPGSAPVTDSASGTYQSGPDSTHCALALTSASLANPTYSIYPISSSDAFLIETDVVSGITPYITAGEMIQQIGQPLSLEGFEWNDGGRTERTAHFRQHFSS